MLRSREDRGDMEEDARYGVVVWAEDNNHMWDYKKKHLSVENVHDLTKWRQAVKYTDPT